MPQISINNRVVDNSSFYGQKTLNEVMDEILLNHASREEVVTNIKLNGQNLSPEDENEALANLASQYTEIDFTLRTSVELAFDALDSCASYIDLVVYKIRKLVELYTQGNTDEANYVFTEIIEVMDLYIQLVTKIHNTIRKAMPTRFAKDQNMQDLEIHLLSILKALIPAKEKNDIIMLCDLLEYELIDNLTQWKIKVIPALKKLKEE
jgi:hypothetical protein